MVDFDHLARLTHPRARQTAMAREGLHFAGELARPVNRDQLFVSVFQTYDVRFARDHHKKPRRRRARFDEHLASGDLPPLSVRGDASDLRWSQDGECLCLILNRIR